MGDPIHGQFFNPTKGSLTLDKVMGEMILYMQQQSQSLYEVIVGCDSSAVIEPTFPLVIVILRKGEGGRFFMQRIKYPNRKFHNLHDRILQEVLLSCELALYLRSHFKEIAEKEASEIKYDFQYIHADVGQKGPTKDMIREVTGLIRGNGFEPKIKPESFASSSVADRFA